MKRTELIKTVATKADTTQTQVKDVIEALEAVIVESLKENREDKIPFGIGSFYVKNIPAKSGVTALGGEKKEWSVPAHQEYAFKVNKSKRAID